MKLYKFLSVDNHKVVSDQMHEYLYNRKMKILAQRDFYVTLDTKEVFKYVPLLKEIIDPMDLTVRRITLINVPARHDIDDNIHVDYDSAVRFLWPIKNCENSETIFFNIDKNNLVLKGPDDDPFYAVIQLPPYDVIESFVLSAPVVMNPGVAHAIRITRPIMGTRLSFTIQFDQNIDHMLSD